MNTVRYLSLMAALGLAGAVQAQTQTPPDPVQTDPTQTSQQPSTSQTEGTAADRTMPGQTPTHTPTQQEPGQTTTPGQTTPSPSTSPTEGTAADRTPPGQTPTQSTPSTGTTETSPMPSTSQSEGTAADRSPPGQTPMQDETGMTSDTTRMAAAGGGMSGMRGSKLIGKNVQTTTGDSLGEVEDVIVDGNGRVTHAVVSHSGRLTAVPWTVLNQSMQGDRLVMERSGLERAPSFEKDQWPNLTSNTWSTDVDSYWSARGGQPR